MASESWSAFTLQATSSWAVEAATCLAEEMSFSSLAWPCTEALAASHRLLVAAATIRACSWKNKLIYLKLISGRCDCNLCKTTLFTPALTAEISPWDHCPSSTAFAGTEPTFPWATSSLWAAEADLTKALVAAAMDLAASRICSSKFRVSSACWGRREPFKWLSLSPGWNLKKYQSWLILYSNWSTYHWKQMNFGFITLLNNILYAHF